MMHKTEDLSEALAAIRLAENMTRETGKSHRIECVDGHLVVRKCHQDMTGVYIERIRPRKKL